MKRKIEDKLVATGIVVTVVCSILAAVLWLGLMAAGIYLLLKLAGAV